MERSSIPRLHQNKDIGVKRVDFFYSQQDFYQNTVFYFSLLFLQTALNYPNTRKNAHINPSSSNTNNTPRSPTSTYGALLKNTQEEDSALINFSLKNIDQVNYISFLLFQPSFNFSSSRLIRASHILGYAMCFIYLLILCTYSYYVIQVRNATIAIQAQVSII